MTFYRRVRNRARLPRGVEASNGTISADGNAILCFPPDGTFFRGLLTTHPDAKHEDSPYALYGRETTTPGQYNVTVADLETGTQYHLNSVKLRGQLRKSQTPELVKSAAIPIAIQNSKLFSMQNSPNFDSMFLNESCPQFEFHLPPNRTKPTDDLEGTSSTFPEDEICSSLSDVIIGDSPPEGPSKSLSDTTSSSRASSMSPNDIKQAQSPQFSLETYEEQNVLQFTANSVYRGQKADMMIQQFMAGSKLMGTQCVVLVGPLSFSVSDAPFVSYNGNMAWSL